MRALRVLIFTAAVAAASYIMAQPPAGEKRGERPARPEGNLVERMMAFDKNKEGKLTKDELTDERLLRIFERADANKDGVVTREELNALMTQENAISGGAGGRGEPGERGRGERGERGRGERGGQGPGGPGGPGGFGGGGPGGPGGPGGFGGGGPGGPGGPGGFGGGGPGGRMGGPPAPGTILPPFLQETLQLTESQKKELATLQKEVDDKLAKILTEDQKKQLKEMRERRGPGGPGGPGGQGGPGGPGFGPGPGGPGGPGGGAGGPPGGGRGGPGGAPRPEGERRPERPMPEKP